MARNGKAEEALGAYDAFERLLPRHPVMRAGVEAVKEGKPLPPPDDPGNPTVNFRGQRRSNETHESKTDPEALLAQLLEIAPKILPYVKPAWRVLDQAQKAGKRVLFEGAQGAFLDVDHGTYPYVTSSNTVAGQAAAGSGIGPRGVGYVLGIVKAYTTRVGEGPFACELDDAVGQARAGAQVDVHRLGGGRGGFELAYDQQRTRSARVLPFSFGDNGGGGVFAHRLPGDEKEQLRPPFRSGLHCGQRVFGNADPAIGAAERGRCDRRDRRRDRMTCQWRVGHQLSD